ncbi:MAG: transport protein TonB [Syntrophaceae bacterium PtaB.Bin038]|nr:MAG: transport protein TonB [Syntrophaceae bacterium PtaB.Bin038]
MNVTTWRRQGAVDLGLTDAGPAERSARQASRRRRRGMLNGIALSAVLHAGVLAFVLYTAANPFVGFPTAGDEGIVRVSLVTVMPGPDNGGGAAPAEESKKKQVQAMKAPPVSVRKAMENTFIAGADDHRQAERPAAETSISVETARPPASSGRGTAAGETARGQRQSGATSQEGYSEASPRYRENRPPVYPGTARQRGWEGDVLIAAEVRADGRIGTVRVKRSSGYASLDNSALEAVRAWRFEPARRMGNPVDAWVEIPIRFKLSPGDSFM